MTRKLILHSLLRMLTVNIHSKVFLLYMILLYIVNCTKKLGKKNLKRGHFHELFMKCKKTETKEIGNTTWLTDYAEEGIKQLRVEAMVKAM